MTFSTAMRVSQPTMIGVDRGKGGRSRDLPLSTRCLSKQNKICVTRGLCREQGNNDM